MRGRVEPDVRQANAGRAFAGALWISITARPDMGYSRSRHELLLPLFQHMATHT